jgi:hypothetical protein
MIPSVVVNELTVVHKQSDGISIGAPDVCLTPAPPAPLVPIPYVNVAQSKDLANQARTVFADGEAIAVKDSYFSTSVGDEPGTGGGVVSGVNKGKAIFANYSMNVFAESKGVARLTDPMLNNGNSPNAPPTPEVQGNNACYDLPDGMKDKLCKIFCWCNKKGNKGGDFIKKVKVVVPGGHDWS